MDVILEAIKFNHNPDSATTDAFNIRKNETEFVTVPEWRRGISINPEDSPAAYAICETRGNTITIQAKFKCTDVSIQSIEVRAVDGQINPSSPPKSGLAQLAMWLVRPFLRLSMGGLLGEVKQRRVFFCEGESKFETFELKNVRIWNSGVRVSDISWRWQFRLNSSDRWTDFAITEHRIYIVLSMPKAPWQQNPFLSSNTQLPWTDVLDYACRWAYRTRFSDDAATRVTRSVNNLGPDFVHFDMENSASSHYTLLDPLRFDCSDFLNLLRAEGNINGPKVNCTDCATILSSFANALGCDLGQSSMVADFRLNPHRRIGIPGWQEGDFIFHLVAWKGKGKEDDALFDACLEVDGDSDPAHAPHTALLPTKTLFGQLGEKEYRFRLVYAEDEGKCYPVGKPRRRIIGLKSYGKDLEKNDAMLEFVKRCYGYATWPKPQASAEKVFIRGFFLREGELLNWQLKGIRDIELQNRSPMTQMILRSTKYQANSTLRVDAYECLSLEDASNVLFDLLAEFQLSIAHEKHPDFGDALFAAPKDFAILFARANLVFLLRNIGTEAVSLRNIARSIDEYLIAKPEGEHKVMRRFYFGEAKAMLRDTIPIHEESASPFGRHCFYKFFSHDGEVSQQNGQLFYHPSQLGLQTLNVFAMDEYGSLLSQELHLSVA